MWQVLFLGRPWPSVVFGEHLLNEDDWEIVEGPAATRLMEFNSVKTVREVLHQEIFLKDTNFEVVWKSDRGIGFFFQGPASGHVAAAIPLYPKLLDVDFMLVDDKPEVVQITGMTAVDRAVMIYEERGLDELMVDVLPTWRRELKNVFGLTKAEEQAVRFVTSERQCLLKDSHNLRYWCQMDGLPVPPALPAADFFPESLQANPKSKTKPGGPPLKSKPAANTKGVKKDKEPGEKVEKETKSKSMRKKWTNLSSWKPSKP